ncbi:DUF6221 family protein [Kitasatospora terrestris]|uniref:Uncharacterized protein n=1 Tax=Kitasatospora terrestris TaxID=258051 RepID=A0ABP9DC54_9ACTN
MSSDLVAFLRARLDEDARIARAATAAPATGGDHVARWAPARVLAETAVKRQLVAVSNADCSPGCAVEHSFGRSCGLHWMGPLHEEADGRWLYDDSGARHAPPPVTTEWTLRLLALPYTGHPEYRPAWAPGA